MNKKYSYEDLEKRVKELERENISLKKENGKAELYSQLLEAVDRSIIAVGTNAKVIYHNNFTEKLFRWKKNELIGQDIAKIISVKEMVKNNKKIMSTVQKGDKWSGEFNVKRKDGSEFLALVKHSPIHNEKEELIGVVGIIADITEPKEAEQALKESEERYRTLFEEALNPIMTVDEKGRYISANNAALEFLEGDLDELLKKRVWDFAPPGFLDIQKKEHTPFVARRTLETRYFVNGRIKTLLLNVVPLEVAGKTVLYGIGQDITDRKQVEEELLKYKNHLEKLVEVRTNKLTQANEQLKKEMTDRKHAETLLQDTKERYSALFDRSLDCLFVNTLDGVFIDANPAALNLLGYKREDISSLDYSSLLTEEQLHKAFKGLKEIIETGYQKESIELRVRQKDGKYVHVESIGSLIYRDGKPYAIQGIARDITKRKQAEEKLKEREKELEIKTIKLEEANIALKVLLKRVEEDKKELEDKILLNINEMVNPFLEKLRRTDLSEKQQTYLGILKTNLSDILSPFAYRLTSAYFSFTPKEMDVANLVKQGKSSKEIADLMNISVRTVEIHRERIREKLGIKGKKINLMTHLLSFQ